MDTFYNKDTVISQLFLLVPVAPGPRVKAEMRNGYSFSLKKLVKLLVEKIRIKGTQGFKIITSIRKTRRILAFLELVIHGNRDGSHAIDAQLNGQTLGKSCFSR